MFLAVVSASEVPFISSSVSTPTTTNSKPSKSNAVHSSSSSFKSALELTPKTSIISIDNNEDEDDSMVSNGSSSSGRSSSSRESSSNYGSCTKGSLDDGVPAPGRITARRKAFNTDEEHRALTSLREVRSTVCNGQLLLVFCS